MSRKIARPPAGIERSVRACWVVGLLFALLSGWARSAEEPGLVRAMAVPGESSGLGLTLAPAGDFDGDGIGDMIIGIPGFQGSGGKVVIASGADGSVIVEFTGGTGYDGFASAIVALGDVDGRGTPDVLVGAPQGEGGLPGSEVPTYARVLAGEDGVVLFNFGEMPAKSRYGAAMALLGDLNGDSIPDFAVARPERRGFTSSPPGSVYVYSGADGGLLALLVGSENGDGFGTTVASVGDVDGDGVPDIVIGSPGASRGGRVAAGRLDLFSGATFAGIRSWRGCREGEAVGLSTAVLTDASSGTILIATRSAGLQGGRDSVLLLDASSGDRRRVLRAGQRVGFGGLLCAVDDRDGDGVSELAVTSSTVGESGSVDGTALVEVYSSSTGGLLFSFRGLAGDATDLAIAPCSDLDGDGTGELAVGIPARNTIAIFRSGCSPIPGSVRVALQRSQGAADSDATGLIEFGPHVSSQPLRVTVRRLDQAEYFPPFVHIETSPGSGEYTEIGYMLATTSPPRDWSFEPAHGVWSPPVSQQFATLFEFAGCRVELRDPLGALLMEAVIPVAGGQDHRGRSGLTTMEPDVAPKAKGDIRVTSSSRRGDARLKVKASGLPRDGEPSLWIEDGLGSGNFTLAGILVRGRLALDSRKGHLLPGAAPAGSTLAGRAVEVRVGANLLLRGSLP